MTNICIYILLLIKHKDLLEFGSTSSFVLLQHAAMSETVPVVMASQTSKVYKQWTT